MTKLAKLLATAALALSPIAAQAHFQLIYTENPIVEGAGDVPLRLIFWHPFENGHAMDMGKPLAFYAVNKGAKIDLMDRLAPITFQGKENTAAAMRRHCL